MKVCVDDVIVEVRVRPSIFCLFGHRLLSCSLAGIFYDLRVHGFFKNSKIKKGCRLHMNYTVPRDGFILVVSEHRLEAFDRI